MRLCEHVANFAVLTSWGTGFEIYANNSCHLIHNVNVYIAINGKNAEDFFTLPNMIQLLWLKGNRTLETNGQVK